MTKLKSLLSDRQIADYAAQCLELRRELAEQLTEADIVLEAVNELQTEGRLCRDAVLLSVMERREALFIALASLKANRAAASNGMFDILTMPQ